MSGFLLKLVRESAGLTQLRLAEQLCVDVATIQGWESARRPLPALQAGSLVRLRSQLLRCGAEPAGLASLEEAITADLIITDAVQAGDRPVDRFLHPLGVTVHQRVLTNLITWPFTGRTPVHLQPVCSTAKRRGPVPSAPALDTHARTRFFDHLLVTADVNTHEKAALLRRQAIYLLGFDNRVSTIDWLRMEQRRAIRTIGETGDIDSYIAVRSSAVALATCGDSEPLRALVSQSVSDDCHERANLNYWAHWVGETDTLHVDDGFMVRIDPATWPGTRLCSHLLARLSPGSAHADLNIHTLWSLLLTHPGLLSDHPDLRSEASDKIELLMADYDLTTQARRELSDIGYAARLARR